MIDVIEIIGLGLCALGVAAYIFYHVRLGKDTSEDKD
jgi:type VI protein secretion system component VasF